MFSFAHLAGEFLRIIEILFYFHPTQRHCSNIGNPLIIPFTVKIQTIWYSDEFSIPDAASPSVAEKEKRVLCAMPSFKYTHIDKLKAVSNTVESLTLVTLKQQSIFAHKRSS